MKIMVVGCGQVGETITQQLCAEKHDVTIVDIDPDVVQNVSSKYDVMGLEGDGATLEVLREAGIESTSLFIAVTEKDEINLICCLLARKTAGCNTIARVRKPRYREETEFMKEELGLSLVLNPDYDAAAEITRILRFPSASKIDRFAKGKVELLKFTVEGGSVLENKSLIEISKVTNGEILISAVKRGDKVFIPKGSFVIKEGDEVSFIAQPLNAKSFFKKIHIETHQVKNTIIAGGGRMSYYLANRLLKHGIAVKIIENDRAKCEALSTEFPQATIICGDATDQNLLMEEGLSDAEGFVAVTGRDEGNMFLSLYAKKESKAKVITKINKLSDNDIIRNFDFGSVITPKNISADLVVSYARAMQNSIGSNVETLYKLLDGKVEALEFKISKGSPIVDKPVGELKIKDDVLVGCINHRGTITIVTGKTVIKPGDTVIVITTITGLNDVKDILK